jgi:putative restriction endonuclease
MMVQAEFSHRMRTWARLLARGLDGNEPSLLRDLGVYGGAQGIWVDKARTGSISPDHHGITMGILHTGRHYPDDLSDEGMIYHYPETGRPPGRDRAEVDATKAASELGLPVFVVLPGTTSTRRRVQLGWVAAWDDSSKQFLILFGEQQPREQEMLSDQQPFALSDRDGHARFGRVKLRAAQQQFRFNVLKNYGCKCAVCAISHPQLIQAAHVRGKRFSGSDDWRNGLPLCPTHHAAFDAHLFTVDPETHILNFARGVTAASIGVTATKLVLLKSAPHPEALKWRFQSIKGVSADNPLSVGATSSGGEGPFTPSAK